MRALRTRARQLIVRRPLRTIGIVFLLLGIVLLFQTTRFLARAQRGEGTIFWVHRYTADVKLADRTLPVSVDKPWWTWPGRYRRGERVQILYEPNKDYTGTWFWGHARFANWAAIWLNLVLCLLAGATSLVFDRVVARHPERYRVRLSVKRN